MLQITGIGALSTDGHDSLMDISFKLVEFTQSYFIEAEFSLSINVKYTFHGLTTSRFEKIKALILPMSQGETICSKMNFEA